MRHTSLTLSLLALVEALTLASGTAVAVTVADRAPAAPGRVVGTTAVAPVVVPVARAVVRTTRPRPHRHVTPRPHHRTVRHASRPAVRRTPRQVVHHAARTFEQVMQQAIARIPGYRPGEATWSVTSRYGHWGIADLGTGQIYISPSVPTNRVYDVVAHEWSHVLSMRDYGMDVNTAVADLNRVFGGSGLAGAEKAADCMARILGARWTHYTSCSSSAWRAQARRLLSGERLS